MKHPIPTPYSILSALILLVTCSSSFAADTSLELLDKAIRRLSRVEVTAGSGDDYKDGMSLLRNLEDVLEAQKVNKDPRLAKKWSCVGRCDVKSHLPFVDEKQTYAIGTVHPPNPANFGKEMSAFGPTREEAYGNLREACQGWAGESGILYKMTFGNIQNVTYSFVVAEQDVEISEIKSYRELVCTLRQ